MNASFETQRAGLVAELRRQGITDDRVLEVMGWLPREDFVPTEERDRAYCNAAVAIESGQTISQPYIVALMTQELRLERWHRVLEIGTGSGYQTAFLALLAGQVYTIERIESLSKAAATTLSKFKLNNIHFKVADGTHGWREEAPFDRIIVTAAADTVPQSLFDQLGSPGILVMPVGDAEGQVLYAYEKSNDSISPHYLCSCRFVPLVAAR